MNCIKCGTQNIAEAKFCSSCGASIYRIENESSLNTSVKPVKKSKWPSIILVISIIISVISATFDEYSKGFSNLLATLGGMGIFASVVWFFVRRIKMNGWRMIDKIVLAVIGILILVIFLISFIS